MSEKLWAPVAGRYGRTRDGRKVGPLSRRENAIRVYFAVDDALGLSAGWWDETGRVRGPATTNDLDLVTEWLDGETVVRAVDFSAIQAGDELDIRFKVSAIEGGLPIVTVVDRDTGKTGPSFQVSTKRVVAHIPASHSIEVGSAVSLDCGGEGEVIAVWEGCAWVRRRRGGQLTTDLPCTYPFDRLTRIVERA